MRRTEKTKTPKDKLFNLFVEAGASNDQQRRAKGLIATYIELAQERQRIKGRIFTAKIVTPLVAALPEDFLGPLINIAANGMGPFAVPATYCCLGIFTYLLAQGGADLIMRYFQDDNFGLDNLDISAVNKREIDNTLAKIEDAIKKLENKIKVEKAPFVVNTLVGGAAAAMFGGDGGHFQTRSSLRPLGVAGAQWATTMLTRSGDRNDDTGGLRRRR